MFRSAIDEVLAARDEEERQAAAARWATRLADGSDRVALAEGSAVDASGTRDVLRHCRTTRARNILRANGLTTTGEFLPLSVSDLRDLRMCGRETVIDILRALLVALGPVDVDGSPSATHGQEASVEPIRAPHGSPGSTTLGESLSVWLAELGARELAILRARVIARTRSLEDLGEQFGVSRERIRQIEGRLTRRLGGFGDDLLHGEAWRGLESQVQAAVGAVASEAMVLALLPELCIDPADTGIRLVELLPTLLPGVERDQGWIATRPLAELRAETIQRLSNQSQDVTPSMTGVEQFDRFGLDPAEWRSWLGYCGLRLFGTVVVRAGASIPELAMALLTATKRPMTSEEIADGVGSESVRSVRNRLLADDRFARVGPNLIGLPDWGLETYEGIREEIVQRIERAGGRVRLASLIEELVDTFGVSPNSVYAYANDRAFARAEGWIFLAGDDLGRETRRRARSGSPAETRRCFLRGGAWWFRVDVGKDALRGSGFPAPIGIMSLFQVAEGTERSFITDECEVRVSWVRPQPTFGSVRPILLAMAADEGDVLWMRPGADDQLLVELARREVATHTANIALHCGVKPSDDHLRAGVAAALGLSKHTKWSTILATLRGRGDLDVADMVEDHAPSEQTPTSSVNDFLTALRGQ